MGIINRFLCFWYSLTVLVLSVIFLLLGLKVLPENVFINELRYLLKFQETSIAFAVLAFFGFYFLCYSYFVRNKKPKEEKEISLVKGDGGEIKVSVDAVKNLAERTAMTVGSVREAAAKISGFGGEDALNVNLDIAILSGANAPQVSSEIIAGVKSELETALSVKDAVVKINVREISGSGSKKVV